MDGREAIIADIIEKANSAAQALISDAQTERAEALERAGREENKKREEALAEAHEAAEAVLSRRATLSSLDARKTMLAVKQQLIDAAFEEATRKILNMTDHIYREFIGGFIEKYADDGDRVIIAERDEKRLREDWLDSLCAKTGKRIALSDERHRGKGGIILSGKISDKNLTLETLMASLREKYLSDVAKRLFKERS